MGARPTPDNLTGYGRDLPDNDLSDHGAILYDHSLSGYSRDLPDVDLSDHGAVPYESKEVYWGTNDEEIVKQMNILMHATYANNVETVVPALGADALEKLIDWRFKTSCNKLDNGVSGKEDKIDLGTGLYMDFYIIDRVMSLNPHAGEQIFSPTLYSGEKVKTDIYGVIAKYGEYLKKAGVEIPLINAQTGQVLQGSASDMINYLMSKQLIEVPAVGGR